jgi:hypothetical protein
MSGDIEINYEKCMKVCFQEDPKIMKMFDGLPPVFKVEKREGKVTVYCPIGYEAGREIHGFKVREFYRIFKCLKVEKGRKLWKGHSILFEPKKTARIYVRFAFSELELLKLAANRSGESLSDYIRAATFTRMARELEL